MTVLIYRMYDPRYPSITRYIGKTRQLNINSRLNQHICHSKYNNRYSSNWIKSLLNNGIRPCIEVIDSCNENSWEEMEKNYIKSYKTKDLTNIEPGGNSNTIRFYNKKGTLKNTKSVIQYDLDGNKLNVFKSIAEVSRLLSINKGVIAGACRRNGSMAYGYRWKFLDDNSEGFHIDKRNTKIIQLDLNNNKIAEYSSIKNASINTSIKQSTISSCVNGENYTAKGFIFKKINN